ncbi:fatty acid desaturase [Oscillatoria laete-virens NRMC-F 0139]|nr:fatty acid desaturase [Oscillatoria laete-virens]MDL5054696.1 fatty acid desaturase [Oscillatoria laete-virens NRMC-F 0139]
MTTTLWKDYSLLGEETKRAEEKGLASADWYMTPIPRERMKQLMQRRDWPAIRDTVIWFAAIGFFGWLGYVTWISWWSIPVFLIYGALFASASDSRWHECGHGTAFKTKWLNDLIYEMASFMVIRESVPWRWSHQRHHTDTIIVGRDPELVFKRPPDLVGIALGIFNVKGGYYEMKNIFRHATGHISEEEKTYIPESEWPKVGRNARIYVSIYIVTVGLAVYFKSFLPIMYVILPGFYGAWHMLLTGLTQHAGLAEDVLDHRLNCRTVYLNPVSSFLYWNMQYHVEHHMYPMVPYYNLPALHKEMLHDTPRPYSGLWEAYREIIPTLWRQYKDPTYYVKRELPASAHPVVEKTAQQHKVHEGWVEACPVSDIAPGDVMRFDYGPRTFAVYRAADGNFHATDGLCTHGRVHLAGGLVQGNIIECPKHNGCFDFTTGETKRPPVKKALAIHPVKVENGKVYLQIA